MKIHPVLLGGALLICGCSRHVEKSFDEMTGEEQIQYCRAQTQRAMMEACTDSVPGIREFVNVSADDSSDAIVKWHGLAEFDYVNHFGGVDRTNLHLVFIRGSEGQIHSLVDSAYYQEQWREEEARILNGK